MAREKAISAALLFPGSLEPPCKNVSIYARTFRVWSCETRTQRHVAQSMPLSSQGIPDQEGERSDAIKVRPTLFVSRMLSSQVGHPFNGLTFWVIFSQSS